MLFHHVTTDLFKTSGRLKRPFMVLTDQGKMGLIWLGNAEDGGNWPAVRAHVCPPKHRHEGMVCGSLRSYIGIGRIEQG
jgi:hypothetical protein